MRRQIRDFALLVSAWLSTLAIGSLIAAQDQNGGAGSSTNSGFPSIPVQYYAAVDISGTASTIVVNGTATDVGVVNVVLDDDNRAAFSMYADTCTIPPDFVGLIGGDVAACNYAYTWVSGTMGPETVVPYATAITDSPPNYQWVQRSTSVPRITGGLYGQQVRESEVSSSDSNITPTIEENDIFLGGTGAYVAYQPPSALYTGTSIPSCNPYSISNNGTILAYGSGTISGTAAGSGPHIFYFILSSVLE